MLGLNKIDAAYQAIETSVKEARKKLRKQKLRLTKTQNPALKQKIYIEVAGDNLILTDKIAIEQDKIGYVRCEYQ